MKKIFSTVANQASYPFILPDLPYDKLSFGNHLTHETFNYHHGKHHQTYVDKLNGLVDKNIENRSLEDLILHSYNQEKLVAIFNNAAQIWNHTFYWHSLTPNYQDMKGQLREMINNKFGSVEQFYQEFQNAAMSQFGSGWVWLVYSSKSGLEIIKSSNAFNPIIDDLYPLVTCDVWEHAYYIDHKNDRLAYIKLFLSNLANWQFASDNLHNSLNMS